MSRRQTIEFIKEYAQKDGTICHSSEYINNKTHLKFECINHHIYYMSWKNFSHNYRCSECYGNKPLTIEYIKNESLNKYNITCLENSYKNVNTKMKFLCKNNHVYYMSWNKVRSGYGCSKCAKNKKYTYEEVKEFIEKENHILISQTYQNCDSDLKIKCPNGHIYKKSFYLFKKNQRCRICFYNSISGINNYQWNDDRTRKKRTSYLSFNLKKINILSDDLNYENFLLYREKAKNKEIKKNIYHVDHIYPRLAFIDNNLDIIYGSLFIKQICNSRENLRIITEEENISKSFKYNQQNFIDWFNSKLKTKGTPIMGERGNIVIIEDKQQTPIYYYTHWKGYKLPEIVQNAFKKAREDRRLNDIAYLNRIIFCTLVGEQEFNETTGYGISSHICDNNYNLLYIDHETRSIDFRNEKGNVISELGTYTFEEFLDLPEEKIEKLGYGQI